LLTKGFCQPSTSNNHYDNYYHYSMIIMKLWVYITTLSQSCISLKNELFFLYVSGPLIQPPIMSKQESQKHTARYRMNTMQFCTVKKNSFLCINTTNQHTGCMRHFSQKKKKCSTLGCGICQNIINFLYLKELSPVSC